MSYKVDCHGESHIGQKRPANEDQFLIADLNKSMRVHQTSLGLNHQTRLFGGSQGKLFLVADGLGGHESGERASTLAVDGIANYMLNSMHWLLRGEQGDQAEFADDLKAAFQHTQNLMFNEVNAIPQRRGMGTTLTMAYVAWPLLYVAHVGDTRCYLLRDGTLKQLTMDHTVDNLMKENERLAKQKTGVVAGNSADETEKATPYGHALYNVIGGSSDKPDPQVVEAVLKIGDSLLLCSDGLTGYFDDAELATEISKHEPAKRIVERLIETANDRGGKDNITVIVAKFEENQNEDQAELAEETAELSSDGEASEFDTTPYVKIRK